MFRKIKEYFKNTDRLQIQQDMYVLLFVATGIFSTIYLTVMIVGWLKK